MPIARLNRDALRQLAGARIEESRVLIENRHWTGAYYLIGLGLECALKSCLAGAVREHDFPDKDFVNKIYVHNLDTLFKLNGALWDEFQRDVRTSIELNTNWETVKDWKDSKRYEIVNELEARALYDATTDAISGVMIWIKARW